MIRPAPPRQNELAHRQLLGRAMELHQRGLLAEAETLYLDVLKAYPRQVDALHFFGLLRAQQGRLPEALDLIGSALKEMPDHAGALANQALLLHRLGRFDEAMTSFDRAVASYERAPRPVPGHAEALLNRGNALAEVGRHEEALASYERALKLNPGDPAALNNRGRALEELRRDPEALASYEAALARRPDYAEAHNNRGNVLARLRHYEEAIAAYDRALALQPRYADALYNRGNAHAALRNYPQALASYEAALALDSGDGNALAGAAASALSLCDWSKSAGLVERLKHHVAQGHSAIGPFALLGHCDEPALLLQCARAFVARQIPVMPAPLSSGARAQRDKIRVAYLSADFRDHVVAHQLAELIELHDRSRFEVVGISFGADDGSAIRARLAAGFDRFLDVRANSDREAAQTLRALDVDIAVDLMGHTRDARLRIFSHRPAPVQVSYLGYAGTMGADFIDYVLADAASVPFDQQPFYAEQIVHLPEGFFANDTKRPVAARIPSRAEAGLPEQGFVFACFCNVAKIQPRMFDVWMRLLRAVDGSVLWLSARNPAAQDNLRREAATRGIDAGRLVFAPRAPQMEDHLARQKLADLFLDTLPYNAHATGADALWAGLPVLTCGGASFAARIGACLVTGAGIPELVTQSLEDYEALALTLARAPARLAAIRDRLEQGRLRSPLFDTQRLCRHIEAAYATMWDICRRGERPRSFAVPALLAGEAR